jgi:hypothetical protein
MPEPEFTNETLATLNVRGWQDDQAIHVAVFTGDESHVEPMPVCLEFPDNEPCLTSMAARALAMALANAADVADRAIT